MYGLHTLGLPLPQEFAITIHDGNAPVTAVAFAIGHKNVAVLTIDEDARRHEELRRVRIEWLALRGAVRGIEYALLPDLKQELASVVRIFLHHTGWSAGNPHVVVFIGVTTVETRFEELRITPRIHHVTGRIKLNNKGSQAAGVQIAVNDVLPVEDEYMVLAIDA